MAYATPADIEARLGRDLDASETIIASTRLNDAERLIKSRIKDLVAKVDSGELDQDVVIQVESDMVLRLVRNPDGFTSEQDGNYNYQLDASVASGRLSVLDDEWALLGVRRAVFMIAPRVDIPWGALAPNPNDIFGPQDGDKAVWWSDE